MFLILSAQTGNIFHQTKSKSHRFDVSLTIPRKSFRGQWKSVPGS